MKNGVIYSLTYLFFTFLTYLWRFSIFSTTMSKDNPDLINNMVGTVTLIFLINSIILILVAYCRGKAIDKKYIVIFPVIAGLFDVVLAFIPLVPTIMNITALITGVSGNKVVYVVQQSEKANKDN